MKKATTIHFRETSAVLKPVCDNVVRKNANTRTLKGPSTRYGVQNELKDQNQLLISTNEDLHKHVFEMENKIALLEQQCGDVKGENSEIQKRLRDCHTLLVAANIDPVLGEHIHEASNETEEQRKEVMNISKNLLNELEKFDSMASAHRGQLEEIQNVMKDLKEAREKLREERGTIKLEVEEMERDLEEAGQLLLE
ncbi:small kinetochore-associated protein [Clupea harengus]|uniref:Small kinetochore-associated protein n=1 Tax=Clupea harengus TaxID=7950 RepID=A0A6P8GEF2_CLUHA|nr:small kinetochore-associated protein [Clupea harengus]XP_031437547.1 small kinetochore-associated protein [Clupea harengus]XP_031437548.1 small kinetochore-associated protein [Clupea harengus]XP_031437549.1 small kinetochore-associated protein [Clupea harengus]